MSGSSYENIKPQLLSLACGSKQWQKGEVPIHKPSSFLLSTPAQERNKIMKQLTH